MSLKRESSGMGVCASAGGKGQGREGARRADLAQDSGIRFRPERSGESVIHFHQGNE